MEKLHPKAEDLLEIIQGESFGLSQRELSRKSNYSRPTVRKYTEELLRDGRIRKIEKGNMALYVTSQGE
ncbi:winged helix-turn-helix domain-containing protein [Candidatus Nanosalina sp. VS9-1]|uniref:winged helix-turn-helix domain-containing protein n=1 Tax=Candidatus Nanosalina sp. VS9-1 TaxID=3388566 RepID=UPI0039E137C8